jgi:hypothetical protein
MPTTVTVKATSVADTTKSATAAVTIQPLVAVTMGSISATVNLGAQRQFNAMVSGTSNTAVTWSAPNDVSVTPQGNYTAPSHSGSFQVIATSVADTTKSSFAWITVKTEPPQL